MVSHFSIFIATYFGHGCAPVIELGQVKPVRVVIHGIVLLILFRLFRGKGKKASPQKCVSRFLNQVEQNISFNTTDYILKYSENLAFDLSFAKVGKFSKKMWKKSPALPRSKKKMISVVENVHDMSTVAKKKWCFTRRGLDAHMALSKACQCSRHLPHIAHDCREEV